MQFNSAISGAGLVGVMALIGPIAWPGHARAESTPEEKVLIAEEELQLEKRLERANTACGTRLKAGIAWDSLGQLQRVVGSFCGYPLDELRTLCQGAGSRAYIKKKIKEVRCVFGGADKRNLTIKRGVVTFFFDWQGRNNSSYVRTALLKKL